MAQVLIENPVINSPFEQPRRHFRFDDEGITSEIIEGRRPSARFVPVPRSKKKGKQLVIDTEWTQDRVEQNEFVNQVRPLVDQWRLDGYGTEITATSRRLLEYWSAPERDKPLFYCQIEALETVIYLTEVAPRQQPWLQNALHTANAEANPELYRLALKMATGSGKTVVMAMLIAWHVLNKLASPQRGEFGDSFLIVTPGITIKDRLRVLLPSDPGNYYQERDLVPDDLREELGRAKIIITNYHAFLQKEKPATRVTKALLAQNGETPLKETPDQMVRRVCREFGSKRNVIVINDEAHHCYRERVGGTAERLTGEDRADAQRRREAARVWISGLEAVKGKLGIKALYDLSATPFFLRGSGYDEGTLFPWVVSDFSLIDAIESGVVKVPRVPVADNSMTGDQPTYRDLWLRIRDDLPKQGRGKKDESEDNREPELPAELEGALQSLYGNYEQYYRLWEQDAEGRAQGRTPPVFIVVCNNTNVSMLVYRHIAGWEKALEAGGEIRVPGKLPLFSNVENGEWLERPNTILVDSEQLESGEAMSPEFKRAAAREIEEFKHEYRLRFPGRTGDDLSDEDLLREVMNTVGKPGRLGEQVRCVVSVSMLTEGWDANTVTHILGVRAFGTQLLCEQVVGRGLRRMSYSTVPRTVQVGLEVDEFDAFPVEYAEVYGVPFSFIPTAGSPTEPRTGPTPTRVRALDDRLACEITFPRLVGYRYELPAERLSWQFSEESRLSLTTADIPTLTEIAPVVGERTVHTLDELRAHRPQEVAFLLAKLTLEKYFRRDGAVLTEQPAEHRFDSEVQAWLFPQVLAITRRWLQECVYCKDDTFPQLLLLLDFAYDAADRIYRAIVRGDAGEKRLQPILRPYNVLGSTRYLDFDTCRPTWPTRADKCHISHVVADTGSWEQKLAQSLEDMPEVLTYTKNEQRLGFLIPYTLEGQQRNYQPDFLACVDDGNGAADPLHLILEVSGEDRKDKAAKVATARTLWVPAVNNHGGFGRWAFLEITDPWDAKNRIRAYLAQGTLDGGAAGGR